MAVVIETEEVMKLTLHKWIDVSIHKILLEIYQSVEPQWGSYRKKDFHL